MLFLHNIDQKMFQKNSCNMLHQFRQTDCRYIVRFIRIPTLIMFYCFTHCKMYDKLLLSQQPYSHSFTVYSNCTQYKFIKRTCKIKNLLYTLWSIKTWDLIFVYTVTFVLPDKFLQFSYFWKQERIPLQSRYK